MSDNTDVRALRARISELEGQLAATHKGAEAPPKTHGRRSGWWGFSSAVLIILACVLAPLSVVSVWARTELNDTNAYVDTVAPLAQDPAVQKDLTNKVTTVVFDNIDVRGFTTDALTRIAAQPNVPPRLAALLPSLAVPITNGVQSFTHDQVAKLVASPQFAQLWNQVNRVAHEQVTRLLAGDKGALSAQGNQITLNLGPIVAQVKARLVAQGFGLASNIPAVSTSFVLVQSNAISKAQGFYSLLNTLGVWLPIITLALFVAGVVLARERRRALVKAALGLTAAMIVLGIGLAIARSWYVGSTPGNVLTASSAGGVFDTLVRFMRASMRAIAVLGLVVALAAFLAGPSTAAVRTRATFTGGIGAARGGAESAGWNTGRFGTWMYTYRRILESVVAGLGGVLLIFWTRPTGWVVVGVAAVVLVLLAVIEFLATPPRPAAAAAAGPPGGPTLPQQRPPVHAGSSAEEDAAPVGARQSESVPGRPDRDPQHRTGQE